MPVPRLRLPSAQAKDLLQVCELGPGKLQDLVSILSNVNEPPIISRAIVRERMSQAIPDHALEPVSRLLFVLAITARDNFVSAVEFATALNQAVSELEWDEQQRAAWQEAREYIVKAIYARDLVIASKAMDLIFDFEKFCLNSRIITDIRPVFDDQRNSIVGGIVMHTLRMEYRGDDGEHRSISIELDSRDVERLGQSCVEATKKMEKAKALFAENKLPTITATEGLE
jgi:hypothetical protein